MINIDNFYEYLSSQNIITLNFIHSFIVAVVCCIPATVFMYEKYIEKKNISHFQAWWPYLSILLFVICLNMQRLYWNNCNPICLYTFSNLDFSMCCIKHQT